MAGLINDLLSIAGFGPTKKKHKSKMTRLKSQERKLKKKIDEKKLEKKVAGMKKRAGVY